eukprot:2588968-Rhodomonas_salina.1
MTNDPGHKRKKNLNDDGHVTIPIHSGRNSAPGGVTRVLVNLVETAETWADRHEEDSTDRG